MQEFDLEIKDKKSVENVVADHLSRIQNAPVETIPINENFPDEHTFMMCKEPWYADITNFILQLGKHLLVGQNRTNITFSRRYDFSSEMNRIYSNI